MKTYEREHATSEYVVLGLKDPQDGQLYAYARKGKKVILTPVEVGEKITIFEFSPFPFNVFSSLDNNKNYTRTYLKVKLLDSLSKDESLGMKSTGIMYYQFGEREIEILEEFQEPFQYARDYLLDAKERLGTWGISTWLPDDAIRSEAEFEAMKEILEITMKKDKAQGYDFDFSLNAARLPYVSFLREMSQTYTIKFGSYGSVFFSMEDIIIADKEGWLNADDLLFLAERIYCVVPLFYHSAFDEVFFDRYIAGSDAERKFTSYLKVDQLRIVAESGFDLLHLFETMFKTRMGDYYDNEYGKTYQTEESPYKTILELISCQTYTPVIDTYDPYEYYCCADCDGYEIEDDDEYEYEIDEQVLVLENLLRNWETFLDESVLPLFSEWSPAIFKRYLEKHPDSVFGKQLVGTYPCLS